MVEPIFAFKRKNDGWVTQHLKPKRRQKSGLKAVSFTPSPSRQG
jgi:hypothetical protein